MANQWDKNDDGGSDNIGAWIALIVVIVIVIALKGGFK